MEGESPIQASAPAGAVFLSYASQDTAAAERICEALRAAGIEVWFDRNALRGGDAWDQKIRREIQNCTLFIPVISQHTQERLEGYFRHEWMLAAERRHHMAEQKAFLVPVVTDTTSDRDAIVPDLFKAVQWTRLTTGETPAAFVERIQRLLSPGGVAAADATRSGSGATGVSVPAARGPIRRRKRVVYVAIVAVATVGLGYLALERLRGLKPAAQGSTSIAVLPLANESGEASQQYFSDGISEDLITALSQFPGLKVIGRTSAFQFRDSREDSRSIGAKLGVAHLLEGSVRKAGDLIRVSAELIDTADGSTQWSERYDRPYKDLFALQDEITHAVAVALRTKLLSGEDAAEQSERPPSGNLEAYNAVLQGRFYEARYTEADIRAGIEHYSDATRLDPRYALAWSSLAHAWATLGTSFSDVVPTQRAYLQARTAATTALTLAPDLPAAHIARGYVLQNVDLNWRGAAAEFGRALQLAPSNGEAKVYLGSQLATLGQVEQAVELTRQALATDPLQANWHRWTALYLLGLGRLDEAEGTIRKAIELQPLAASFHETLVLIQVQRGDAQAALATARQETELGWRVIAMAIAQQIGADRTAADAALKALIDGHAEVAAYQVAEAYAIRNDADNTFAWLDRAWTTRDSGLGDLLYDPFILRYKDDPRFAAFCGKVGLPVPGAAQRKAA